MVLPNPNNGSIPKPDLYTSSNGATFTIDPHRFSEEIDSNCSTPYASAPSSPGCGPSGYFFSAPASPMHYVLSSTLSSQASNGDGTVSGSFEFEFSSRFSGNASVGPGSMSSADELFCNGQIRPMKLSSHLQRPQFLAPLLDLEVEEYEEREIKNCEASVTRGRDLRSRNRSMHRKTRSLSPLRDSLFRWPEDDHHVNMESEVTEHILDLDDKVVKETEMCTAETTPSTSAPSSRSSSSGRNSKKWIFLKDFLYRSKSEGRANPKDKFWSSVSFSVAKEKHVNTNPSGPVSSTIKTGKQKQAGAAKQISTPANGIAKRRPVAKSAHELHYTANRAQAEEMKKKTYLPYRQGLFGCLGFSSKSYGALNGFSRSLNPVSSR